MYIIAGSKIPERQARAVTEVDLNGKKRKNNENWIESLYKYI